MNSPAFISSRAIWMTLTSGARWDLTRLRARRIFPTPTKKCGYSDGKMRRLARITARHGNAEQAHQHVAAAKAALDKANNPDQLRFYPYLTGYVAFYAGDYKTAIAQLQKADQRDPLNLALLGEAFEKSGDAAQAREYYGKVLEINIHNSANAFARPLARRKQGS